MIKYENGDIYQGELKKGKQSGEGIFKWTNGVKYIGDFDENKKINGVYFYSDQLYIGNFKGN